MFKEAITLMQLVTLTEPVSLTRITENIQLFVTICAFSHNPTVVQMQDLQMVDAICVIFALSSFVLTACADSLKKKDEANEIHYILRSAFGA